MDTENLWTVQWSEKQQCFHVDQLDRLLTDNLRKFIEVNQYNDWALIAIMPSRSEAHKVVGILREKRGIKNVFERFAEDHPE